MALSSYAPPRIWRINPYVDCPFGMDGRQHCDSGGVSQFTIANGFTDLLDEDATNILSAERCDAPFAVEVLQLEYISSANIAVTILYATMRDYDVDTGLIVANPVNPVDRVVRFLSTGIGTMQMRDIPWYPSVSLAPGMLCPAMRRLPNLGSMLAEMFVCLVQLARFPVRLVTWLPGLSVMWREQRPCSLVTHGHSILEKCGAELLSLDEFFQAQFRLNAHFWHTFSIVSNWVRGMGQVIYFLFIVHLNMCVCVLYVVPGILISQQQRNTVFHVLYLAVRGV